MTTTKKQFISTILFALVAVAVIVSAFIVLKTKPAQKPIVTTTHLFSESDIKSLKEIDKSVTIYIFRDEKSFTDSKDMAEISYNMILSDLVLINPKINVEYFSQKEATSKMKEFSASDPLDSVFVCGDAKTLVKYSELTKTHSVSKIVYAIDRSLIVKGLCEVSDVPYDYKSDFIPVTDKYDKDGDNIGTNLRAYMFPALERKDMVRIAVTNKSDTYFAYKEDPNDKNSTSFFFAYDAGNGVLDENGEPQTSLVNTSYDASLTSSLIVSTGKVLSTSKLYDVDEADYGLKDKSKATLIAEIYTKSGEYHILVVGDKTPSGTGYYAKYYYAYAKDAMGDENYVKMLQKVDADDNIAQYSYVGKQLVGKGVDLYTKPFIYVIGTDIEGAALHPLSDYLISNLVYTVSDQEKLYTVDDIHINFMDRGEEIVANLLQEDEAHGFSMQYLWKIISPKEYFSGKFTSPSNAFFEALNTMVTLSSEKIVEYKMELGEDGVLRFADDILKEYGLDTPELSFSYRFNDTENKRDTRTVVYVSPKDENGNRYAYSYIYTINSDGSEKANTTGVIALLPAASCEWMETRTMQFIEPNAFSMYIQFVNSVTLEFDGKKYDFVLLKEGETVNDVSCNGKKVDLQSFRYMYQTILGIKTVDKYEPTDTAPSEMLKMTIQTEKGEYAFVFSRVSVKKALCVLNGEGSNCVGTDLLMQLMEEAEKIAAGESIR